MLLVFNLDPSRFRGVAPVEGLADDFTGSPTSLGSGRSGVWTALADEVARSDHNGY